MKKNKLDVMSFREFLLIFRKAAKGELQAEGLQFISQSSISVDEVGVGGAKNFFEAKVLIYYLD